MEPKPESLTLRMPPAMTPQRYHSADDMRDSIEGLFLLHGRQRPVLYWALLLVTAAGLTALPLVKVDTSVGAPGQIRPAVERLRVYPAVSGRIHELRVFDNHRVEAGAVLLRLDATALDARIGQNEIERQENDLALADLALLLAAWNDDMLPGRSEDPAATPLSSWPEIAPQTAPLLRQQALLRRDLQRLLLQWEHARQELARSSSLHARGLVTEQDQQHRYFGLRSVEREMELVVTQALNRWQSDRLERELREAALRSEAEQLAQQRELYFVRAPVAGTAIGFAGLHPGLFVLADQALGDISPSAALQADVFLSPRDVGFIRVDQPVSLQIDAFPYTEWGVVRGRVRSISQDFVQIGTQVAFKAVVELESTELRSSAGTPVELRRGMTAQARFFLQRRSLFHLLFGKLSDSLDPRAIPTAS
jgi:membrane fusion protein, peptide pheromone/bacteriocin exporter